MKDLLLTSKTCPGLLDQTLTFRLSESPSPQQARSYQNQSTQHGPVTLSFGIRMREGTLAMEQFSVAVSREIPVQSRSLEIPIQ